MFGLYIWQSQFETKESISPYSKITVAPVEARLTNSWYKCTAKASHTVAGVAPHKLRPRKLDSEFKEVDYGPRLVAAIVPCLGNTNIDQEGKSTFICAGTIRSYNYVIHVS